MTAQERFNFFFTSVVIPYCKSISTDKQIHVVVDLNDKLVYASKSYISQMGTETNVDMGTLFDDVYNVKLSHPQIYKKYQQIKNNVITQKKEVDYLCITKFSNLYNFNIVEQSPLFHSNGEVIGTFISMENITHTFNYNTNNSSLYKLSKRQAEIIFLLTIGASQKEIANIFNISRGTISSSINQICIKLNLPGSSEKTLISKAIELNIGSIPFELLTTCIIPIHKLYNNSHTIKHLFKLSA